MKQGIALFILMTMHALAMAEKSLPPLMLDTIRFQLAEKQWVTTQTALLEVTVNMTLNNADLIKARATIMTNLNKIAQGDWHITQFDRSQDSSGLEKLVVHAEARIAQNQLTNLYHDAKKVSMPGAQYAIASIDFKPSLEENQSVRALLRTRLYQKINEELARINKAYPLQHYTVKQLMFQEGNNFLGQSPRFEAKAVMALADTTNSPTLTTSDEIILNAIVDVAANRKEDI